MCGIAGGFDAKGRQEDLLAAIESMMREVAHRGPDDAGLWRSDGVVLGHRRLSVIDLSPEGHQPMVSADGRLVLTYNGEIYNYRALRAELESGQRFRGNSDTEVLLAAISAWGLRRALARANGMFALALYDIQTRKMFLARDRMGEKPLFYGWFGTTFAFASELRALVSPSAFEAEVDRDSLVAYLRHGYVPEPRSIFKGIHKLKTGSIAEVATDAGVGTRPQLERYWDPDVVPIPDLSGVAAVDALEELLRDAVGMRMVADVPVGAFLSGGIDSSLVVALMQAQSSAAVRTFSIGFEEPAFDEAPFAAAVAEHLGTEHTELYVSPAEARAVIPRIPQIFGEPFADASQIPTFLVSELARRDVTVSLSGDGGDELFGGYERYFWGRRLWRGLRRVPAPIRHRAGSALALVNPGTWDKVWKRVPPIGARFPGNRVRRVAELLATEDPASLYLQVLSHVQDPASLAARGVDPVVVGAAPRDLDGFTQWMVMRDLTDYLPGDILTKLDRATMAVGLEGRVPLLDHRVVEFAIGLPLHMKIRGDQGKWVLRQALDRYVPRSLVDRPKMGFGVPVGVWLRGPLRQWADDLLDTDRLRAGGFLDADRIARCWTEHIDGSRDWQYVLWDVLMFEAWLATTKVTGDG